ERLSTGEQLPAVAGELGANDRVGERADRLDAEVDPGLSGAGERLEDLVADRKRRRDQDLLVERLLPADPRQLLDVPRRSLFWSFFKREQLLFRHEGADSRCSLRQTKSSC